MKNERQDEASAPPSKWDVSSLIYLGSVVGGLGGMAYEMGEIFLANPSDPEAPEMESFADIFLDMAAAAIAGATVFGVVAVIRNRVQQR